MSSKSKLSSSWKQGPGVWFSIVAIVSLLWNLGGAAQFINSITASEESLKASMMTTEQIAVLSALPVWVDVVFGIGAITSIFGSVLLYMRSKRAFPLLAVSLISFVLLSLANVCPSECRT
jgi:nitric oxide reductase large subunit